MGQLLELMLGKVCHMIMFIPYIETVETHFLQYCEVSKVVMLLTFYSSLIQTLKLALDIVPSCVALSNSF